MANLRPITWQSAMSERPIIFCGRYANTLILCSENIKESAGPPNQHLDQHGLTTFTVIIPLKVRSQMTEAQRKSQDISL